MTRFQTNSIGVPKQTLGLVAKTIVEMYTVMYAYHVDPLQLP